MVQKNNPNQLEMVEAVEYGGRRPTGLANKILMGTALSWALFQLWVASPLPFSFGIGVFNDTETRSIHLAFAIFLAYLFFPFKRQISEKIPLIDWLLALTSAFCAAYLFLFYEALAERAGAPLPIDVGVAVLGVLLLLEATRRALGWPLMLIGACFLGYTFGGPWLPDLLAHKGASPRAGCLSPVVVYRGGVWSCCRSISRICPFFLYFSAACWNRLEVDTILFGLPMHWWDIEKEVRPRRRF